jgi:tight adherence protein C
VAAVLAALAVLAGPAVGLAGAGAAVGVPVWQRRRRDRRARAAIVDALPDTVDLLVVAVAAGLNVALALRAVGPRAPPAVGGAIVDATRRIERGERAGDALARLPATLGDDLWPLVTVLTMALLYGAPLLEPLERLAGDARGQRRRAAEEAARREPVKLLFPLVVLVLPAFALLTVVPLLAGTLRGLRL